MDWQKEMLEQFFGAEFAWIDPMHEMRFESGGIRYRLWLLDHMLFLTGDVRDPDDSFPAIEIGCECRDIEETEASGVGPVLHVYASIGRDHEQLRLCITRDREGRFSISPHWPQPGADT